MGSTLVWELASHMPCGAGKNKQIQVFFKNKAAKKDVTGRLACEKGCGGEGKQLKGQKSRVEG